MKNEEEESKEFVVFCDCKSKYKERKDEIETWERERESWKLEGSVFVNASMPTTLNNVIGFFFIGLEGVFFWPNKKF